MRRLLATSLFLLIALTHGCSGQRQIEQASPPPTPPAASSGITIDCETLAAWLLDPGHALIVYDVRNEADAANGGIAGAQHLDYDTALIEPGSVQVPEGNEVVVHCYSGIRSMRVAKALRDVGVQAYSLSGGIHGWEEYTGEHPDLGDEILAVRGASK